jgi:outer membrane protein assembly factor BamB
VSKKLLRIWALTLGVLVFSVSSSFADALWRQYGFNAAHTSYNPAETILSPSNVSSLSLFWKSNTPGTAGFVTAPVLGFDLLFFGGGRVRALEKQTGQRRWARLSCSAAAAAQPAFGREIVLVGDSGGDLAGYDPATGNRVWCNNEGGSIVSAPAIAGDTAFITNGEAAIAVVQSNGALRWRFAALDVLGIHLTNTPAFANGVVYVTGEGSVVALDGITGRKIWRQQIQASTLETSSAAIADGIVYVGGYSAVYALSAADGHLVWQSGVFSVTNATTPAIAEGRIFVNSEDPGLYAFDASTGAFLWGNGLPGESRFTVTVANGVVYDVAEAATGDPATHGRLMMFDAATGKLIKKLRDPDGQDFIFQPVVANGTVYVSALDHIDAFALP